MTTTELHPHLTILDLAPRWSVTPGHLRNMRCQGSGPQHLRLLGGAIRYPLAAIEEYEHRAVVATQVAA